MVEVESDDIDGRYVATQLGLAASRQHVCHLELTLVQGRRGFAVLSRRGGGNDVNQWLGRENTGHRIDRADGGDASQAGAHELTCGPEPVR